MFTLNISLITTLLCIGAYIYYFIKKLASHLFWNGPMACAEQYAELGGTRLHAQSLGYNLLMTLSEPFSPMTPPPPG